MATSRDTSTAGVYVGDRGMDVLSWLFRCLYFIARVASSFQFYFLFLL
jgi:hypothetical protein